MPAESAWPAICPGSRVNWAKRQGTATGPFCVWLEERSGGKIAYALELHVSRSAAPLAV